jgi:hypothetical protein
MCFLVRVVLSVDGLHPLGKLKVLDKSVATDELALLAGKVDEVIASIRLNLP